MLGKKNNSSQEPKESRESKESIYVDIATLRELTDYQEGKMPTDDNQVFLGKLNNSKCPRLSVEQTVEEQRKVENRPKFIGKVLNPEARLLQSGEFDKWSPEKNLAFMLGAIEAKKEFLLVTPTSHYSKGDIVTGTKSEILLLADNNYSFKINPDETMTCTPPEHEIDKPVMVNYWKLGESDEVKDRLAEILQYQEQREARRRPRPWQDDRNRSYQRQYTPAASSESWRKRGADTDKENNSTRPVQSSRENVYQPPSLRKRRQEVRSSGYSSQRQYSTSTESWRQGNSAKPSVNNLTSKMGSLQIADSKPSPIQRRRNGIV